MKNQISIILALLLATMLSANNITVVNMHLTGQNTSAGVNNAANYTMVQFDISWENSWRNSSEPYNWDAAWVFVKYRIPEADGGDGLWKHAWLNNTGHNAPTGSTIDVGLLNPRASYHATTNPGLGAFIYRNSNGTGTNSWTGVQLRWNYGANEVADDATLEVNVCAVEMVYVPDGTFTVGSGGAEDGSFTNGSWTSGATIPLSIVSEDTLIVANTAGNLWYTASSPSMGDRAGPVPAAFPKGYNAFYCMKYEITQQGFVDFLNSLTYTQQATRTPIEPNSDAGTYLYDMYRHKIKIYIPGTDHTVPAVYITDYPYVACNWIGWGDVAAYLDWSGLRPMTEFEFEKACRGTLPAVAEELAWGTAGFAKDEYTLSNPGLTNETIATDYSTSLGNAATESTIQFWGPINGPVRAGIFAGTGGNTGRVTAGATYYGIMEMSGNLYECPVTVGNAIGRAFSGTHGNGALNAMGNADATTWPGTNGTGAGLRGGDWNTYASVARVSDRADAAGAAPDPDGNIGGRGVRLASHGFITEWRTTSPAETITLPLNSGNSSTFNCIVYWGDGTSSKITSEYDSRRIHTYASAGDYRVEIVGTCEGWSFDDAGDKLKIRKIIHWGTPEKFSGFKYLKHGFYGCSNLSTLGTGSILASGIGCTASGFELAFAYCSSLSSIPTNLFRYHTAVSTYGFTYAFRNCTSLASIPTDLFRYNTLVSTFGFYYTFYSCTALASLPEDLFRYNTQVSTYGFYNTFAHCTSLTTIPGGLFRYNTLVSEYGFSGTFEYCTSLVMIPSDLFRYNTLVSEAGFSWLFYHCTSLKTIPEDLFRYNTLVSGEGFYRAFFECASLNPIPAHLFDYNTEVSANAFYETFYGCSSLTAIPSDLFRYNTAVSSGAFFGTFVNCSSITSIPAGLFRYNTSVSFAGFYGTFYGCSSLTSLPSDLFSYNIAVSEYGFYNTFAFCTSLTSVPSDLFLYNTAVSTDGFGETFNGCYSLTSIPSELFKYNTLVSGGFNRTFALCYALTSIPADLFRFNTGVSTSGFRETFASCENLASIPADLFKYNTLVSEEGFYRTFSRCFDLTVIPGDLFMNNTLVSTSGFRETFSECTSITTIPAGLFQNNPEVSAFGFFGTFNGCSALTTIPADLFRYNTAVSEYGFYNAFAYCISLPSVPANLFRYNTAVSEYGFYQTFYECLKLQLNRNIFFADGEETTRFLDQSPNFTECFYRDLFTGTQGEAPALWNCDFGTGTPEKTGCYGGAGNSTTSLNNYASIPVDWR